MLFTARCSTHTHAATVDLSLFKHLGPSHNACSLGRPVGRVCTIVIGGLFLATVLFGLLMAVIKKFV